jgi:hypothetical protein
MKTAMKAALLVIMFVLVVCATSQAETLTPAEQAAIRSFTLGGTIPCINCNNPPPRADMNQIFGQGRASAAVTMPQSSANSDIDEVFMITTSSAFDWLAWATGIGTKK